METVFLRDARPGKKTAVTVGSFDGIHLGHQAILRELLLAAREAGGESVLVTFQDHPRTLTGPEKVPLITSASQQDELLAGHGVDRKAVIGDRGIFSLSAADFIEDVLLRRLGAAEVVIGYNFRFGRGRSGDAAFLREQGRRRGFGVRVVDPVNLSGETVSSTMIRRSLSAGDVVKARAALGRFYEVRGIVASGAGRGRGLGFPTANLETDIEPLTAFGVYETRVACPEGKAALSGGAVAVASYGVRPTFGPGGAPLLEVHVPGFTGDLVGCRLHVSFVSRLRGEQFFPNAEALAAKMREDVARVLAPGREDCRKAPGIEA